MYSIGYSDFARLNGADFLNFHKIGFSFTEIAGISTDTRSIGDGEVFWALVGERFDGHDFLKNAAEKNALFAVVNSGMGNIPGFENFGMISVPDTLKALQQLAHIQRLKYKIPLVAVTGSNGKTTVKEMIYQILNNRMNVHKTEGNLNNHIGCPLTLLKLKPSHQAAVIEIGMNHPGEIAALSEIASPTQAVITDVSGAHLEFFGSVEAIAREKLSVFDKLPAGSIIYQNLDNPFIAAYHNPELQAITFSTEMKSDITGKIISLDQAGCAKFILNGKTEIQLQVGGVHNVKNALAAAAVGTGFGLKDAEIRDALESYKAYSKRMQITKWNGITIINDAYNANPSSMIAAFETVRQMRRTGRLFLALGSMFELGEKSGELHIQVLDDAVSLKPEMIGLMGEDFVKATKRIGRVAGTSIENFTSYESFAQYLTGELSEGDLLLVKGSRGMTMEKILQYLTGNSNY